MPQVVDVKINDSAFSASGIEGTPNVGNARSGGIKKDPSMLYLVVCLGDFLMTIHVVARLTARPETVAELHTLLLSLLEPTRQ